MGYTKVVDPRTKWLLALSLRSGQTDLLSVLDDAGEAQMQKATVPSALCGIERFTGDACFPSLGDPSLLAGAVSLDSGVPAEEPLPLPPEADSSTTESCYEELTLRASPESIQKLRCEASAKPGWKIVL